MYRTGDIGRRLCTGSIEYHNRRDGQIKIRGIRIERSEVESALDQHPLIHLCLVVKKKDHARGDYLVAHVVPTKDKKTASGELRQYLRQKLPDYMIPSDFVYWERFPITQNGKVDMSVLEARTETLGKSKINRQTEPSDEEEKTMVKIWKKVLQTDTIELNDDFFELGGHSFLAIQLLDEIYERFGKKLSLTVLFSEPTIKGLTGAMKDTSRGVAYESSPSLSEANSVVAIRNSGGSPPVFFAIPLGGLLPSYSISRFTNLSNCLGMDQPFFAVQSPALLKSDEDEIISIEERAQKCVTQIVRLQRDGPYYLGGWCTGGVLAFEIAQQLQASGRKVGLLALLDADSPRVSKKLQIVPEEDNATEEKRAVIEFLYELFPEYIEKDTDFLAREFEAINPAQRWENVVMHARRSRILGIDVTPAVLDRLFRAYKSSRMASNEIVRKYKPRQYSDLIQYFRAQDQEPTLDPTRGWQAYSKKKIISHNVPGGHVTILSPPHVEVLAGMLRQILMAKSA